MIISENIDIQSLNTFGVNAKSKYFVTIRTLNEVKELLQTDVYKNNQSLILGGGSNILFTSDFDGLIIKNELKGKEIISSDDEYVWLKLGAGEIWHDAVLFAVENNWGGIENLSLIPGTVGAAPMQNIGAYGVEMNDVFSSLEAVKLETGELCEFSKEECHFGYRKSVFKNELKNQYLISSVTLKLRKVPQINISYGAISKMLEEKDIINPDIQDVSNAVISIRKSKLPDPNELGNAGSFFKNPIVSKEVFIELEKEFPAIVNYPDENGVKIPAGWLIDQAGWKGRSEGEIGVHKLQALVLVNYGNGTGKAIYELSQKIKESIFDKYGINLEREVNII